MTAPILGEIGEKIDDLANLVGDVENRLTAIETTIDNASTGIVIAIAVVGAAIALACFFGPLLAQIVTGRRANHRPTDERDLPAPTRGPWDQPQQRQVGQ